MIEEHRDSQNDTDIYKKEKKVKLLSRVRLFATPWTVAYHAPSSIGFPRQEYWSGLPFPSPMYGVWKYMYKWITLLYIWH